MKSIFLKSVICAFTSLCFIACTEEEKVFALVNGRQITEKDLMAYAGDLSQVGDENQKKIFLGAKLESLIEKYVIEYEEKRLKMSEAELFGFFEDIKQKELSPDEIKKLVDLKFDAQTLSQVSKDEIVVLLKDKLFEDAKKKYISELKKRSTIRYKEKI